MATYGTTNCVTEDPACDVHGEGVRSVAVVVMGSDLCGPCSSYDHFDDSIWVSSVEVGVFTGKIGFESVEDSGVRSVV